jgi:hypothetical protein
VDAVPSVHPHHAPAVHQPVLVLPHPSYPCAVCRCLIPSHSNKYLITNLFRTILISETDDDRSDDEGDDEGDDEDENTKENEKKPAADKKSRPLSRLREKETPEPSASKTATAAAK